jgi:hypothetical protein
MATMLGSASRARELNNLFAVWKCAFDLRDQEMMTIAKRAIDAAIAGRTPSAADMTAIENYVR